MIRLHNLAARVFRRPDWQVMALAAHEAALAVVEAEYARQLAEVVERERGVAAAYEAVAADRARMAAVTALPEAQGRLAQAWFLGTATSLPVETIAAALAASAPPRRLLEDSEIPGLDHEWRGHA